MEKVIFEDPIAFIKKTAYNKKFVDYGYIIEHIGGGFFVVQSEMKDKWSVLHGDYFEDAEVFPDAQEDRYLAIIKEAENAG
jgi:hypothetical protein